MAGGHDVVTSSDLTTSSTAPAVTLALASSAGAEVDFETGPVGSRGGIRPPGALLGSIARPAMGVAVVLALWSCIAWAGIVPSGSVPTPWAVLSGVFADHSFYVTNAIPTTITALQGYAVAVVVSLLVGSIGSLTGLLERSVSRVALAVYCLPLPALLPLISSVVAPGQQTRVTMAALFSFFPILVGVLAGLRSTPAAASAVVHCAGGGQVQVMRRVGFRSALPQIMAGLRIAAPGALLGSIVAEFGGAESGLGVALVVSQQKFQVVQTWGLAAIATLIGGLLYAVVSLSARLLRVDPVDGHVVAASPTRTGFVRRTLELATPPLVLVLVWLALVRFSGASPLIFKSPTAVFGYLITDPDAGEHRSVLTADWLVTMQHTAVVFAVGMLAATAVSCLLVSFPVLLQLSSPALLVSQCVPQIAFIPLLVAICGRGMALIVVTGLLVVVFPAVIVISTALEQHSRTSIDLVHAYGGGRWAVMRRVRMPGAVPGLISAAMIGLPLAMFGALVAEWLVTGTGIAEAMSTATVTFDYTRLWADVAAMTITVVVLYGVLNTLHERARRHFC